VNVNPVAVATGVVAVGTTELVRSTTTDVAADNTADDDPTLFVAITETFMYASITESVRTYVLSVAELISVYVPLDAAERDHWYEYEVGEPVHELAGDDAVKVSPVRAVPEIVGRAELVGVEEAK
jgi:hypothetical protein